MAIHIFLAHLPYTLLLVGTGADVAGAIAQRDEWRRVGGFLLILGALAALLAFFTGQAALSYAFARPGVHFAAIEAHTQWGGVGVWFLAICGGLRAAWRHRLRGPHGWITLALGIASSLLIVAIARSGLAIAHGG